MAKISEINGRTNSTYADLFGDGRLGHLMSQTHGAMIRMGTELEKLIIEQLSPGLITTITNVSRGLIGSDKEIIIKPEQPKAGEAAGIISDFAIFNHQKSSFIVIELKNGDVFDTQKAPATKKALQSIVEYISGRTGYKGQFFVCSFNVDSNDAIVAGFKQVFSLDQVMTGQELCFHLGIDYEEVLSKRKGDQEENKYYFMSQIEKIELDLPASEYFAKKKKQIVEQFKFHWVEK